LPARDVLALVPGLMIETSQATCCGVAGTYGLKTEKYQIAMDVGAPLFEWFEQSNASEALCDSETCRWQISHATGYTTRHPIELLLDAYRAGDK
jgi:glycerol-3-phosphate dehydrogenase subunit C